MAAGDSCLRLRVLGSIPAMKNRVEWPDPDTGQPGRQEMAFFLCLHYSGKRISNSGMANDESEEEETHA